MLNVTMGSNADDSCHQRMNKKAVVMAWNYFLPNSMISRERRFLCSNGSAYFSSIYHNRENANSVGLCELPSAVIETKQHCKHAYCGEGKEDWFGRFRTIHFQLSLSDEGGN
ncbi:hypothetical protein Tcan_10959 [Toxocara canis]|uniref:Uncharacterized protein n=1 Tax=Toxocara canis TaxID=6265 RepID=A0A0B2V6U7_TOXCA|nr:hypothetical protein Tcan_10959 [Toxocara canis]